MADCGSSSRTTSSISDYTRKTTFDPASQAEQDLLAQFSGLGKTQNQALLDRLDALTSGTSPYTLSPEDQAMVDRAYNAAQVELALGNKDYADYLAGGRGLRMSDTPIAQSALQRQGLGLSSLLSEKARTSLDLGLQGNQYRNSAAVGLSSALPAGSLSAFNPLFQERLASGRDRRPGGRAHPEPREPRAPSAVWRARSRGRVALSPAGGRRGRSGSHRDLTATR